jgi:hypothetical protein
LGEESVSEKNTIRKRMITLPMLYFFHRRNGLSGKMLSFYNRLKHRAATEAERCAKAQEVHAAAVDIRNSLRDFKGNEFVNYYLHCAIINIGYL